VGVEFALSKTCGSRDYGQKAGKEFVKCFHLYHGISISANLNKKKELWIVLLRNM
jgi:hypothetical protein